MEIGDSLYVVDRKEWRAWLAANHHKAKEIWLIFYRKASGKARLPYNDAVEEALCFGWIDSIMKARDEKSFAQRFTPRRKNSQLSELNKERIRKMIKMKQMTDFGLAAVKHVFDKETDKLQPFVIPKDILKKLKADKIIWQNFTNFSESYQRVRISWIDDARKRPEVFNTRLSYFLKMTAKNKQYGMMG